MNTSAYPFVEGSFWLTPSNNIQPSLQGAERCDVVIVGGGYTGLCAALRLREKGVDVALVEQGFCGSGASGRNAGHVTPTIGKDVPTCIKKFGVQRGLAFVRFAEQAIEHFERLITKYNIECNYQRTGNIIAGVHEKQRKALYDNLQRVSHLGVKMCFLDEAAMQERGLPSAFKFGVLEDCGGTIHPGKYVLGLREAALAAGVRIYEQSAVTHIEEGSSVVVHTQQGTLTAEQMLLATNAYGPAQLGLLKSKTLPVRVSLFVTRPLTAAERNSIGWQGQEGVYTAHELLENYRITPDGRVLGGSKVINYAYGSKLANGYQPESFQLLERTFRERFPTLGNIPIECYWGGWIAMTFDFMPVMGRLGKHKNIMYYAGCNGHGIPQCSMMGGVMAEEILGGKTAEVELFQHLRMPMPPEPLRWSALHAINGYLAQRDRKIDKLVAHAASL